MCFDKIWFQNSNSGIANYPPSSTPTVSHPGLYLEVYLHATNPLKYFGSTLLVFNFLVNLAKVSHSFSGFFLNCLEPRNLCHID